MSETPKLDPAKVLEDALANHGRVSLALLLRSVVPLAELREFAKEQGVSTKGFRIDRAPAKVLAEKIVQIDQPKLLEGACVLLAKHLQPGRAEAEPNKPDDLAPLLRLRDQDLEQAREELQRTRQSASQHLARAGELERELAVERDRSAGLRSEVDQLRRKLADMDTETVGAKDQAHAIHDLERELTELEAEEARQRRLLAERASRIRSLEERVAEVEALIPPSRLKKKKPLVEPSSPPASFRRPYFTSGFLKSLEGKDRRSVEAAFRSVFLFCIEGDGYPGLQVKQLDPANVWSFRAALKLRIYFRRRGDGDVDLLALADREEQDSMLRHFRETQGRQGGQ